MNVPPPPETKTPGALLNDALGSFGKAVGALAGAGIFLYLIGVGVLWQRLSNADLRAQEVVATLPRDQLAIVGAREALLSAVSAAIFGLFLWAVYRLWLSSADDVAKQNLRGKLARGVRDQPATVISVPLAIWCALIVPMSPSGALFLVLFLAVVWFGIRSAQRSLLDPVRNFRTSAGPWVRVAIGLASAVLVVSISRQGEFPDRFSIATIAIEGKGEVCGLYLGSTSDVVILGLPKGDEAARPCASKPATSTTTLLVARKTIERIGLTAGERPLPPHKSILRRLGVPVECISPVCQLGDGRQGILELFLAQR